MSDAVFFNDMLCYFFFKIDPSKLQQLYVAHVLQRRLLNNVFRLKIHRRIGATMDQRRFLAVLLYPHKAKVKAIRNVSQLTGVPRGTVTNMFANDLPQPETKSSAKSNERSVKYIPRIDPDRFEFLLQWIDDNIPVKSGRSHRVMFGKDQHHYNKYRADCEQHDQKVRKVVDECCHFVFHF